MSSNILKATDLHVHLLQSLYPQDIFEMAKDCYIEIPIILDYECLEIPLFK